MKKKTPEECKLEAGLVLGRLQNAGFGPLDAVKVLTMLLAYLCERQTLTTSRAARDAVVRELDAILNEVN